MEKEFDWGAVSTVGDSKEETVLYLGVEAGMKPGATFVPLEHKHTLGAVGGETSWKGSLWVLKSRLQNEDHIQQLVILQRNVLNKTTTFRH